MVSERRGVSDWMLAHILGSPAVVFSILCQPKLLIKTTAFQDQGGVSASCFTTAGEVKGVSPEAETTSALEIINISPVSRPRSGFKQEMTNTIKERTKILIKVVRLFILLPHVLSKYTKNSTSVTYQKYQPATFLLCALWQHL